MSGGWVEAGGIHPTREVRVEEIRNECDTTMLFDHDSGVIEVWVEGRLVGLFTGQADAVRLIQRVRDESRPGEMDGIEYHVTGGMNHEDHMEVMDRLEATGTPAIVRRLHPSDWEVWFAGDPISTWASVREAKLELAHWMGRLPSHDAFKDPPAEVTARLIRRIVAASTRPGEWLPVLQSEVRWVGGGYELRHPKRRPEPKWLPSADRCAAWMWHHILDDNLANRHTILDVLDQTWDW